MLCSLNAVEFPLTTQPTSSGSMFSGLVNQEYHGMGSRSARMTLLYVIALVFSSLAERMRTCLQALGESLSRDCGKVEPDPAL